MGESKLGSEMSRSSDCRRPISLRVLQAPAHGSQTLGPSRVQGTLEAQLRNNHFMLATATQPGTVCKAGSHLWPVPCLSPTFPLAPHLLNSGIFKASLLGHTWLQ